MDARSAPQFRRTFDSSVVFVTLINLAFGLFAWLQFGSCNDSDHGSGGGGSGFSSGCIAGNVIDNLRSGPVKVAVQVLLSIDLIFTSIVFLYVKS